MSNTEVGLKLEAEDNHQVSTKSSNAKESSGEWCKTNKTKS